MKNGNGTYRGLPPLAGWCTFEQASGPGLSVDVCVERLRRYHYTLRRLHQILTARITAEPIYELKMALSHHAYLCAEHIAAVRTRVREMRDPPLRLERVPDASLEVFFDEILASPTTAELIVGVYEKALPALKEGLERHVRETNHLADAPTVRIIRFMQLELEDMLRFGREAVAAIVPSETREAMKPWLAMLDACLAAAGNLDGASDASGFEAPDRMHSIKPYVYDRIPQRDDRWKDLWNRGVNAEALLYDETMPMHPKLLMMLFKRLREVDVPEMMASIIVETRDKPWQYYRDMSRQLWDEARHAMMGQIGFEVKGVDWTLARLTHNFSYVLNTQCTPIERHAVLYYIEQGLMSKTGKRFEWEVGVESGDPLAAVYQDYDWADEVLHARIGRDWYVKEIGDRDKAVAFGDETWARITNNWQTVKDKGLTSHENWWPALYRNACESAGITPDPKVLAFNRSYEGTRMDQKNLVTESG